jgi:hypothetical protein
MLGHNHPSVEAGILWFGQTLAAMRQTVGVSKKRTSAAEEGAEKVGLWVVKRKPGGAKARCKQGPFGTTEVVP